jgi:hypothetical protein
MENEIKKVAILFSRSDSVYFSFPECDVYDINRNALLYPGKLPVICHPPCRGWGRLKYFSKHPESELLFAPWSVEQVRKYGGVLEHPSGSSLWKYCNLPTGSGRDHWGGFTLSVDQFWFGHKARKRTLLYICGCSPAHIPDYSINFNRIEFCVGYNSKSPNRFYKEISKSDRERTPFDFASWLIALAKNCKIPDYETIPFTPEDRYT